MATQLLVPPTMEPVSLDEAKEHLRVDQEADDAYITGLVIAARQLVEDDTRRALLTQDWQLTLPDAWPTTQTYVSQQSMGYYSDGLSSRIGKPPRKLVILPRPPVQSIVSVNYLVSDFTTTLMDPSQYRLSKLDSGEWAIRPAAGITWPSLVDDPEAATIVFRCGYGDRPGTIPEPLRIAMLLVIAQWYDNRMPLNLILRGQATELPNAYADLVFRYRVFY
jgi:hypothetical protein